MRAYQLEVLVKPLLKTQVHGACKTDYSIIVVVFSISSTVLILIALIVDDSSSPDFTS